MVLLGGALGATPAHAGPNDGPPGASSFRLARVAWERGSLETAEPLYKEAIEKGGLDPKEVLEGYVRLGAIRAALGKKDGALAAWRAASVLDANFTVPREAGKNGEPLAERAKKDTAKFGSIKLGSDVPREVPSGKAFKVTASLDKAHLPIVTKISLIAKDGTSGKEVELDAKPDETVDFEIASDVTLPGASIVVRVDALDSHQNRIASTNEKTVHVSEKDDGGPKVVSGGSNGNSSATSNKGTPGADTGAGARRGVGFWSTPWPYIIGGAALIGLGTAVYFGVRPTQTVSVSSPNVENTQ